MLTAAAIIPSTPLLVPELAGTAADVADLRDAVLRATAVLPDRWIAVGIGAADARIAPDATGTFAGFGVDVRVALSPGSPQLAQQLPLSALITGWVRGQIAPHAVAEVRCYGDTQAQVAIGRALRADIDATPDPIGVLIVADGCRTLTASAPGGYEPAHTVVQEDLDDALAHGEIGALVALPPAVVGRAAFGVLAGLTEPAPSSAKELYRGAPYGVGYFVGVWQP